MAVMISQEKQFDSGDIAALQEKQPEEAIKTMELYSHVDRVMKFLQVLFRFYIHMFVSRHSRFKFMFNFLLKSIQ